MTIHELAAHARRIAREADDASAVFAAALAGVVRDTERALRLVISRTPAGVASALGKGQQAAAVKAAMRAALTEAGFDAVAVAATDGPLDTLAATVLTGRTLGVAADRLLRVQLAALKALHLADLLDEGDVVARALWQATARGIFGSQSVDRILADLAEVLDRTAPHIRTLYDTSISIYGRQVEVLAASDDKDAIFLYLGPDDDKTRPFCEAHVGRVYTRKAIDAMDNGSSLGSPVLLVGGGWACRHSLIQLSKFSEFAPLADTGERVPDLPLPLPRAA